MISDYGNRRGTSSLSSYQGNSWDLAWDLPLDSDLGPALGPDSGPALGPASGPWVHGAEEMDVTRHKHELLETGST